MSHQQTRGTRGFTFRVPMLRALMRIQVVRVDRDSPLSFLQAEARRRGVSQHGTKEQLADALEWSMAREERDRRLGILLAMFANRAPAPNTRRFFFPLAGVHSNVCVDIHRINAEMPLQNLQAVARQHNVKTNVGGWERRTKADMADAVERAMAYEERDRLQAVCRSLTGTPPNMRLFTHRIPELRAPISVLVLRVDPAMPLQMLHALAAQHGVQINLGRTKEQIANAIEWAMAHEERDRCRRCCLAWTSPQTNPAPGTRRFVYRIPELRAPVCVDVPRVLVVKGNLPALRALAYQYGVNANVGGHWGRTKLEMANDIERAVANRERDRRQRMCQSWQ